MVILPLIHDGKKWIVNVEDRKIEAMNLDELDEKIREYFRGKTDKVLLKFEYSTIPHWMRQFHPHYFNRIIII